MDALGEGAYGLVDLLCSPTRTPERGGAAWSILVLAQGAHQSCGGMPCVSLFDLPGRSANVSPGGTCAQVRTRAVGLSCSPNAHTRPIVFIERRCSSKRAVRDQSALIPRGGWREDTYFQLPGSERVNDCKAIGGWRAVKTIARDWAVRMARAVGSSLAHFKEGLTSNAPASYE